MSIFVDDDIEQLSNTTFYSLQRPSMAIIGSLIISFVRYCSNFVWYLLPRKVKKSVASTSFLKNKYSNVGFSIIVTAKSQIYKFHFDLFLSNGSNVFRYFQCILPLNKSMNRRVFLTEYYSLETSARDITIIWIDSTICHGIFFLSHSVDELR